MTRFGLRRRLFLVVVATVVVAIAALVAAFNLLLSATLDGNARDLVRSRAEAQLASLRVEHGRLEVGETPDNRSTDAFVWVFTRGRMLQRPRAADAVQRAVGTLLGGRARYATVSSEDTLLYATPVLGNGRRLGTAVAGVSLSPYEETRSTALLASLVFGGTVLVLVGLLAWWLLGASLRPVVQMTRQAAAWRVI